MASSLPDRREGKRFNHPVSNGVYRPAYGRAMSFASASRRLASPFPALFETPTGVHRDYKIS